MKKIFSLIITVVLTVSLFMLGQVKANTLSQTFVQSFSDIPDVTGVFTESADETKTGQITFTKKSTGHEVRVKHPNGTTYILATSGNNPMAISLPGITEERELILNSGVLFKGQNNEQLVYYELQNPASSNTYDGNIFKDKNPILNGFRPFVIWNPVTGIFDVTDKLTTYIKYHEGTNRRAYADIVFPIDLDNLLMISLGWSYRYRNFLGNYTSWRNDTNIFTKDDVVNTTSFWGEFKLALQSFAAGPLGIYFYYQNWDRFNTQAITDLGSVSGEYQHNYVYAINSKLSKENKPLITVNDLFSGEHSIYRIYMNTYNEGLYTSYEIQDDIGIIDIMYEYKGEYFHPRIEDVEWISVGGSSTDVTKPFVDSFNDFINFLEEKVGQLWPIVIFIFAVIVMFYLVKLFRWLASLISG